MCMEALTLVTAWVMGILLAAHDSFNAPGAPSPTLLPVVEPGGLLDMGSGGLRPGIHAGSASDPSDDACPPLRRASTEQAVAHSRPPKAIQKLFQRVAVEQIMIARRLIAGISQYERDLRPMTDLMNENVQKELAGRHGDALPADLELV
jgi:hypothetical protein